ncbi:hypothetical protein [Brevundimonas aveniformis]|uniref:hypothetical protein n=1 Tax=Brevundimonas aveniformis TaxID=370977 RepID=UPI000490B28A|nr:hypothetical protein [Brevundimonas aveniformis]
MDTVEAWPLLRGEDAPLHAMVSIGLGGTVVAVHGNRLLAYDFASCGPSSTGVPLVEFPTRPNAITVTDYSRLMVVGNTTDGQVEAFADLLGSLIASEVAQHASLDGRALESNRVLSAPNDRAIALANPYQIVPVGLIGLWQRPDGTQSLNQFSLNTYMHFGSREPTDPWLLLEIEGLTVSSATAAYPGSGHEIVVVLVMPDPEDPSRQLLLAYTSTDPLV